MRKASGGANVGVSATSLAAAAALQKEPRRHIDAVEFQAEYVKHQDDAPWETLEHSELMREVRAGLEHVLNTRPEFPVAALAGFLKERRAMRNETAFVRAVAGGQQRLAIDARLQSQRDAVAAAAANKDAPPPPPPTGGDRRSKARDAQATAGGSSASASAAAPKVKPPRTHTVSITVSGHSSVPLPRELLPESMRGDESNASPPGSPRGVGVAGGKSLGNSGSVGNAGHAVAGDASGVALPPKKRKKIRYTHPLKVTISPFPRSECADPEAAKAIKAWAAVSDARNARPQTEWASRSFTQCGPIPLFGMYKPTASALDELMASLHRDGIETVSAVVLHAPAVVYIEGHPHTCDVRELAARQTGAVVSPDQGVGWVIEAMLERDSNCQAQTVAEEFTAAAVKHRVHFDQALQLEFRARQFITAEQMARVADFTLRKQRRSSVSKSPGLNSNMTLSEAEASREALVVVSYVDDDALSQTLATAHCVLAQKWKALQVARLRRADEEAVASRDIEREHELAEAKVRDLRERRAALKQRQAERDERRRKSQAQLKLHFNDGPDAAGVSVNMNRVASQSFAPPTSKADFMKTLDGLRSTADEREKRRKRNDELFDRMVKAERSRAVLIIRGIVRSFLRRLRQRKRREAEEINANARLDPLTATAQDPNHLSTGTAPPSAHGARPLDSRGSMASSIMPASPTHAMPGLAHTPGHKASPKYDTANEEFERDVNYAAIRLITQECLECYPDALMTDSPLPPPMPRDVGEWNWKTTRIKPTADDDCSSEDEEWTVDFTKRTYLPPLTTRHTNVNARDALVNALVDCGCDWRRELFDARVLYAGVAAIQKRATKMLGVTARLLLLSVYSLLRTAGHASAPPGLSFCAWVQSRHPRIHAFLDCIHVGSAMVPLSGPAIPRIDGPNDLHELCVVRLPDPPLLMLPTPPAPGAKEPPSPLHNGQQQQIQPSASMTPASQALVAGSSQRPHVQVDPAPTSVVPIPPTTDGDLDALGGDAATAALWYTKDAVTGHIAESIDTLRVTYAAPKTPRVAMLAALPEAFAQDATSTFVARRLHPRIPVVLCSPSASTRALHLLAVALAQQPPPPPAASPPPPASSGGIPGSPHGLQGASSAGPKGSFTPTSHGMHLGLPGGRQHGSSVLNNSNNAATKHGSGISSSGGGGGGANTRSGSPIVATGASNAWFLWWYAGSAPLFYVGGRPHAAVMRAAAKQTFASAHITQKSPPGQRKPSSGVMQPKPPRGGPAIMARTSTMSASASASIPPTPSMYDASETPRHAPSVRGGDFAAASDRTSVTSEEIIRQQQQQREQQAAAEADPVRDEYPAWPEATIPPAPTAFGAAEERWGDPEHRGLIPTGAADAAEESAETGDPSMSSTLPRSAGEALTAAAKAKDGGVSWAAVEARVKTALEADVTNSDGVLFRYAVAPGKLDAVRTGAESLDDVELKPEVVRVVKSKKPPPKAEDAGKGDGALDRKKSRHAGGRSVTSLSQVEDSISVHGARSGSGTGLHHPAPPTMPNHHGSQRLRRDSAGRASLTESVPASERGRSSGSKARPLPPLPTSASDGLVQSMDEALSSVLTLPLTHAAAAGTSDGQPGPLIPQQLVRLPAFETLEEHIRIMSRVVSAIPRTASGGGSGGIGSQPLMVGSPLFANASTTSNLGPSLAAATSTSSSTTLDTPPTQIFFVSTEQDVVNAAAAAVVWCAWCAPPQEGGPLMMLHEAIARHGRDYTRPPTAADSFVPGLAVDAVAETSASSTDDEDLVDESDGGDEEIDEVESQDVDGDSNAHRPLFATVTLSSRAKFSDSFTAERRRKAAERPAKAASPTDAAPNNAEHAPVHSAAFRRYDDEEVIEAPPAAFQPLACITNLAKSAELASCDFDVVAAQHCVTALLLRTGLYGTIRKPIDDVLELERDVLRRSKHHHRRHHHHEQQQPTADELREKLLAASRALERYALLVFAHCYATSEAWRGQLDRTFADFVAYYAPLRRFLEHPDTLFASEVPFPQFNDGLFREGEGDRTGGLSTAVSSSALNRANRQQPASARGPGGGNNGSGGAAGKLPQTARAMVLASALGRSGAVAEASGPVPWPITTPRRVDPLSVAWLLAAERRWTPTTICHSLA